MKAEALPVEENFVVPQQSEVEVASSPLEHHYVDQKRREARSLIDAQENLLTAYKSQLKNRYAQSPDVQNVIDTLESKGDFVSAELIRDILAEGKIINVDFKNSPVVPLNELEIESRRNEARREINKAHPEDIALFKEKELQLVGNKDPLHYIAMLEQKHDFLRAAIAKEAFIESGILTKDQTPDDIAYRDFVASIENFILNCEEDPRRTVNRLHHQGRFKEAHIMAELLKKPEMQRKIADIGIGRTLIKDIRDNQNLLQDIDANSSDETIERMETLKAIIKEDVSLLKKYLAEGKITLTQIGLFQSEFDTIQHSLS